jgi:lipopolysaccharide export LptBFGC system permease protein LptF
MPKNVGSLILKLIIGSFFVGWFLTLFDITPLDLLKDLTGTIGQIYATALDTVRWAADYILLGAVIVVPIWAIVAGLNYVQKRSLRKSSHSKKPD